MSEGVRQFKVILTTGHEVTVSEVAEVVQGKESVYFRGRGSTLLAAFPYPALAGIADTAVSQIEDSLAIRMASK